MTEGKAQELEYCSMYSVLEIKKDRNLFFLFLDIKAPKAFRCMNRFYSLEKDIFSYDVI